MYKIDRILDANVNRAAEGIRVVEDICRFYYEDSEKTELLRNLRHRIRKTLANVDARLICSRDSEHDIGKEISAASILDDKKNIKQLINANFKRAGEGIRVMEETLKIAGMYRESKDMESIRYEAYYVEKEIMKLLIKGLPEGLYCITAEKHSRGRNNIEVVKEMLESGVKIIQYREKDKKLKEKYEQCMKIRDMTREYGTTFIVNDDIDIALLVDADGVHIGQDDLPVAEVRKLIGDKIIGVSTHSPEQAEKAVADGADYIGVGPLYSTKTKVDVCAPVGLEYLDYAVKNIKIPFIAIGGIKEHNVRDVVGHGAVRLSLVTEIVGAENIKEMVEKLNNIIKEKK